MGEQLKTPNIDLKNIGRFIMKTVVIEREVYAPELIKKITSYLYCDACRYPALMPVHGHYICTHCLYQTR